MLTPNRTTPYQGQQHTTRLNPRQAMINQAAIDGIEQVWLKGKNVAGPVSYYRSIVRDLRQELFEGGVTTQGRAMTGRVQTGGGNVAGKRTLSAEARQKIAAAAKRRWAKARAQGKTKTAATAKSKPKTMAAGA